MFDSIYGSPFTWESPDSLLPRMSGAVSPGAQFNVPSPDSLGSGMMPPSGPPTIRPEVLEQLRRYWQMLETMGPQPPEQPAYTPEPVPEPIDPKQGRGLARTADILGILGTAFDQYQANKYGGSAGPIRGVGALDRHNARIDERGQQIDEAEARNRDLQRRAEEMAARTANTGYDRSLGRFNTVLQGAMPSLFPREDAGPDLPASVRELKWAEEQPFFRALDPARQDEYRLTSLFGNQGTPAKTPEQLRREAEARRRGYHEGNELYGPPEPTIPEQVNEFERERYAHYMDRVTPSGGARYEEEEARRLAKRDATRYGEMLQEQQDRLQEASDRGEIDPYQPTIPSLELPPDIQETMPPEFQAGASRALGGLAASGAPAGTSISFPNQSVEPQAGPWYSMPPAAPPMASPQQADPLSGPAVESGVPPMARAAGQTAPSAAALMKAIQGYKHALDAGYPRDELRADFFEQFGRYPEDLEQPIEGQ